MAEQTEGQEDTETSHEAEALGHRAGDQSARWLPQCIRTLSFVKCQKSHYLAQAKRQRLALVWEWGGCQAQLGRGAGDALGTHSDSQVLHLWCFPLPWLRPICLATQQPRGQADRDHSAAVTTAAESVARTRGTANVITATMLALL